MAEGVNDDMRQQQRNQDGVPHGQDVPSQELDSTAASVQKLVTSVGQSSGNGGFTVTINPATKKKSSFQITSITQTKSHSRGDSNGYGDLNESDIVEDDPEVEVVGYSDDKKNQEPTAGGTNGNGGSRFKVVKISRNESYQRGRWMCLDFPDSTESIPASKESTERQDVQSNSKHVSFSSTTSNHVAVDMDVQGDLQGSSKSTSDGTTSSSSVIFGSEGATKLLKKKDSDLPTTWEANTEFLSSNAAANTLENIDKLSAAALSHTGDVEMPIVNVIAAAMEQITQIKSDLLCVVNKEVQTLKETIAQLKEENEGLKQENQRLKEKVDSKSS